MAFPIRVNDFTIKISIDASTHHQFHIEYLKILMKKPDAETKIINSLKKNLLFILSIVLLFKYNVDYIFNIHNYICVFGN